VVPVQGLTYHGTDPLRCPPRDASATAGTTPGWSCGDRSGRMWP